MNLLELQDIISTIEVYNDENNSYIFTVWNSENSYPTKFEHYFAWEVVYIYKRNDDLCCNIKSD